MSNIPAGLESLDFEMPGTRTIGAFDPILVGVVGSGNLEVLLEPWTGSTCQFHVETSARGYGDIWAAVLGDFHERHGLAGVRISVNDMGATPAVVSLRLAQAAAELPGDGQ